MLTRDDMIRESQHRSGTLPGLLVVYGAIIGTMAWTASLIV